MIRTISKYSALFISALLAVLFTSIAALAETATIPVDGMTCGSCVNHLTSEFKKAGYSDVVVKLEEKIAVIQLPSDKKVTDTDLQSVITKAGYKAGDVARK